MLVVCSLNILIFVLQCTKELKFVGFLHHFVLWHCVVFDARHFWQRISATATAKPPTTTHNSSSHLTCRRSATHAYCTQSTVYIYIYCTAIHTFTTHNTQKRSSQDDAQRTTTPTQPQRAKRTRFFLKKTKRVVVVVELRVVLCEFCLRKICVKKDKLIYIFTYDSNGGGRPAAGSFVVCSEVSVVRNCQNLFLNIEIMHPKRFPPSE